VVSDEHGNPVKVTGILHDITDLKKSENEIRLKNEELQKAIAEKDKFFSILAHDLRSPFNAFLGFTKMMVDELPSLTRDQITKIAISMNKSANNTYRLLANLLEWSRLQRGLIHVNPEPFLLMRQTAESLEPLLESANMKGIEIRFNIPDDMIVYADGNMLGSIIRNLTSNAVKFTRRGGKINISAKLLSDSFIEVSVNDNGMGMSKQLMKDLFCLEESANRKGTAGEPSTGLGLIICKEFIEKHGGKLWVESEEENLPAGKTGGSTFYFTIPVNQ
jgi:signal transduction histidine kinase